MHNNLEHLEKMTGKEMLAYLSNEIVFGHTFKTFEMLTTMEAFNLLRHAQKEILRLKYESDDDTYICFAEKTDMKLKFIKEIIER